jgi:CelD/BcsL family acetyltransferase involved in cellulose biosynthesis
MPEPIEFEGGLLAANAAAAGPVLHSVTTLRSFGEAEAIWRDFEGKALATPYQRFDWLDSWFRHIGAGLGIEPLIVIARKQDGSPALIWPLGVRMFGPARVGRWLGCKLANYKLGLYDRETVGRLNRATLAPVLDHLRKDARLDGLFLTNQPETWEGIANPLLCLPHQDSPSFAYSLALRADFSALYNELRSGSTRKKLRRSERRIADEYGSCALRRPQTPEDVDRILSVFAEQKAARMEEKHLQNVFAAPGVMAFFRESAIRGIGQDEPLLDLLWIDAGGRVAATWAGTSAGGRMCGIVNSFDLGEFAQHQPGEVMLRQLVEDCCRRGLNEFDLGVGEAQYKYSWCPRTDRLFDTFLGFSAVGWASASVASAGYRLKRSVKKSKTLSDLTNRVRGRVATAPDD